jgi:phosphinothricin acetyltransferase
MTTVSIRPATPADIPTITRIYAHAVAHGTASFELEAPDEAEMAHRQRALLDGG